MNRPILFSHPNKAQMIAHRGLSGLETENSAAAFVAAGQHPYFGIETDVHRTKDGQFIIIHDNSTGRVCNENLPVEETDFSVLSSLRLKDIHTGAWRQDLMLPTLSDYLSILRHYGKHAVLELKRAFEPEDIQKIISIVDQAAYLPFTTFISFKLNNLISLRSFLPHQSAQYLVEYSADGVLDILKEHRLGLDIDYTLLTGELVEKVHALGQKVNVWTVDEPKDAIALCDMGVDQITSNILL
ncbi:MAG: hypothetical protein IKM64_04115 [Clostridia bacterium]|nr:hypothetical protein [Clostridia bacterium]